MRIIKETLNEIIEHKGEIKHGPLNSTGVLRLALDLRDARCRIEALEEFISMVLRKARRGRD